MFDFNFGGISAPDTNTGFNYETEQARIKRLLAQAAMYQKAGQTSPEGKMVGNQFVAPHWSQQLSPVLNSILGGLTNQQADSASADLERKAQEQARQLIASRPQQSGGEIIGSIEEPLTEGVRTPIHKPTQQEQLDWAGKLATNPLTKTLAGEYMKDILITEPDRVAKREDTAALAREKMTQDAALKQESNRILLRQVEGQLESKSLDRESRERMQNMADETKRQLAANDATLKGMLIEARTSAAANKTVPPKIIDAMTGLEKTVESVTDAAKTFKPEYAGAFGTGTIKRAIGDYSPVATDAMREGSKWWKAYDFSLLEEMHKLYGSALTKAEQERWSAATIDPNMDPGMIQANLQTRAELATKMYNAARERYSAGVSPKVGELFLRAESPFATKETSTVPAAVPTPPASTKGQSESDAMRRLVGTLPDTRSPEALRAWGESIRREMPSLNAQDRAVAQGLLQQLDAELAGKKIAPTSVLPKATGRAASGAPAGIVLPPGFKYIGPAS